MSVLSLGDVCSPAVMRQTLQFQAVLERPDFTLDVDLQLPGRGVTALFGASGSGKTTCLRVLAGLEPRARGRIGVDGDVWQDSTQHVFRPVHQRRLGYVFQEASLFAHLDVQANVKFGFDRVPAAQRKHGWDQALALLGIGGLLERRPHELSGGERQRVAIARALATSPRLLLMDEPLASLDGQRKAEILPYIERLHVDLDIPVLYVSHSPDEVARLADHLVLLEAGRVLASGPTHELMTRTDLPLSQGDSASAIVDAVVTSLEPDYHLCHAEFSGGRISVVHAALQVGQRVRLRIQARDVSITLERQSGTSVQNTIGVLVTQVSPDGNGQVMLALDAKGSTLLARITHKSADTLGLTPGCRAYAQVKGVAVLV
ncbi:MAG: modC [Polaromonas sp.]|nr:modC [Polaromonas sp.]